jgi:multiple sugar transport system substrate-binding protein
MKKVLALVLSAAMLTSTLAGCSNSSASSETATSGESAASSASSSAAKDVITVLAPPVTNDYVAKLDEWKADFNKKYPNLTLEVTGTSWDDHTSKLSTMASAGEAPDLAELTYTGIGTYVQNGTALDISQYMDAEQLKDFDETALNYMKVEGKTYGLPLYVSIQALGANKDMLAAAGVDVAKVQTSGWTFDEFKKAIKAGTDKSKKCFGFVFADGGITTSDLINVFGVCAGLNSAFSSDLKYDYTSKKMYNLLTAIEEMVKSGDMPNYGVEAAQRLVMCETGNAMIFGKAMPLFENNITKNNAALKANDGTAVKGSIPVNYAFIPVPTMEGVSESCFGSVDGFVAFRNKNFSDEHEKNVMTALYYLCSGERAAYVDDATCLPGVCKTAQDVLSKSTTNSLDKDNIACAQRLTKEVIAPPSGVTADQSAKATKVMNEVIVPKFQALLAGEITAQQMYDEVVSAGKNAFGADGCVLD